MTTRLLLAFDGSPSSLRAARLLDRHAGEAKPEVRRLTVHSRAGGAAPGILAAARRQKASAIVMGTRGAGALRGYALGSVALRVAHKARVPVILVKARDRLPAALGRRLRVLLATDGSAPALRAARRLVAWRAWLGELEVHLLWVQQPLTYLETVMPPHDDVIGQWSRREGDKATRPAVALLRRARIAHRVHFSVGDPALEARSLVEDTGAELLVLGTRGLGAAHHALVGSVALKAAVACPVPALLVP
jgi:nucleotide-binding universal stress UspA family protein